jgi:hypothetical protein
MGECGAPKWTQHNKGEENPYKQLASSEHSANQREKEMEHFLDGKRPENVPIPRKIPGPSFQNIDAERQRRQ